MPKQRRRRPLFLVLSVILTPILLLTLWQVTIQPSNDRHWKPWQQVLATADIQGDTVTVHNVRNFRWSSKEDFTPEYDDRSYDLNHLSRIWFISEPFSKWKPAAHTFVSFEFTTPKGPDYLDISIETRMQVGQEYSVLKGFLHTYELQYIIGDDADLLQIRTSYRQNDVYLYPIRADAERRREMFLSMLRRANALALKPEFYNSAFSSCTSNLIDHVRLLVPGRLPTWNWKLLLPGYADELAYKAKLIDTDLSYDGMRKKFFVTEKGKSLTGDPHFSEKIREGLTPSE